MGAEGTVIGKDIDVKGNIRVWTQYKVDGVEVDSNYPKMDGKQVYCTRYNKRNFLGMSKTEVKERVDADLISQCQNLIGKEFDKKAPKTINEIRKDYNAQANQDFVDVSFPVIIGNKVTEIDKTIILDTDNDGVNDKEIKVKTDGTKVEKNI